MFKSIRFALVFLGSGVLTASFLLPKMGFASYGSSFERMSHGGALKDDNEAAALADSEKDSDTPLTEDEDPLEGFNRIIFAFNEVFDGILLRPLAETYNFLIPDPIKEGVGNVLGNLAEPLTFMNDVLQLKFDRAGETFSRFVLNTTFGLGGIFDVADEFGGIRRHKEDFGQTLGHAGLESGPYLVLPFIGPSNFRDMIGTGVDILTDPVDYGLRRYDRDHLIYVRKGVDLVHKRAIALPLTKSIDETAADKYIRYRIYYNQYRNYRIQDENVTRSEEDAVEMVE